MVWNVEASRTVAVVCEFPWSSFVHCAAAGAGPLPSHAISVPTTTCDHNLVRDIVMAPPIRLSSKKGERISILSPAFNLFGGVSRLR